MITKPKQCDKCGGEMDSIEYSTTSKHHYDGVSEYACPQGHYRIGRWCGQELINDQVERVDCVGIGHARSMQL